VLNSRDALPMGGDIEIQVSHHAMAVADMPAEHAGAPGPYVRLRVADTGTGIPPEVRPHLFEPFFTTKGQARGTGLGLASVYGIVNQSGGFIVVDSPAHGGTVFCLYFPAVLAASATADGEMLTGCERILLVEDEESVRVVVGALLRRNGYHVFEAATPNAARDIFAQQAGSIDLLLTDVVMPEMNGPALAQRCVAEKPGLRVLFISGYAEAASAVAGAGPQVRFLEKPFQATALTKVVRELLDQSA
jgi:two-component system, cell cycle sensor histidine kinase and response regulator CckA